MKHILFINMLFAVTALQAQPPVPSILNDTIPSEEARLRSRKFQHKYRTSFYADTLVTKFELNKLQAVMDLISQYNRTHNKKDSLQLEIGMIRKSDIPNYYKGSKPITKKEWRQMKKKPIIFIKLKKEYFPENTFAKSAEDDEFVYLDFGKICPPPNSCN